jgi:hypothetical protein
MFIIIISVLFMMSAAALMFMDGAVYEPEPSAALYSPPDTEEAAEHEPEPIPEARPKTIHKDKLVPEPVIIPEPRGAEYFRNAIFIGDSITTGFSIWREHIKIYDETLDDTIIFALGSYGLTNSVRELSERSNHPELGGVQMRPEDAVAASGVERAFISLGLNDVLTPLDSFLESYALLVNRILEKSPHVEIIILPVPPYMHEAQPAPDRNAHIAEYNSALGVLAGELGVGFIDSTAPLRCENGGLREEFCGDPPPRGQGCHWLPGAYGEVLRYMAENPA